MIPDFTQTKELRLSEGAPYHAYVPMTGSHMTVVWLVTRSLHDKKYYRDYICNNKLHIYVYGDENLMRMCGSFE